MSIFTLFDILDFFVLFNRRQHLKKIMERRRYTYIKNTTYNIQTSQILDWIGHGAKSMKSFEEEKNYCYCFSTKYPNLPNLKMFGNKFFPSVKGKQILGQSLKSSAETRKSHRQGICYTFTQTRLLCNKWSPNKLKFNFFYQYNSFLRTIQHLTQYYSEVTP